MKIIIASDLHGSLPSAKAVLSAAAREGADLLVLLGDLYYHGPRNPLPEGYAPMETAALLDGYQGKMVALRGNCDAAIDQTISTFPLADHFTAFLGKKSVFMTHGHVYSPENPPKGYDILINGHFHTARITENEGVIYANPGSPSLPKEETPRGYLLLEEGKLTLKALDGTALQTALW